MGMCGCILRVPFRVGCICFYSTFATLWRHPIGGPKLPHAQTLEHKSVMLTSDQADLSNRNFQRVSFEWEPLTMRKFRLQKLPSSQVEFLFQGIPTPEMSERFWIFHDFRSTTVDPYINWWFLSVGAIWEISEFLLHNGESLYKLMVSKCRSHLGNFWIFAPQRWIPI